MWMRYTWMGLLLLVFATGAVGQSRGRSAGRSSGRDAGGDPGRSLSRLERPADSLDVQLDLLARFYQFKGVGLFWFGGERGDSLRAALRAAVDSAGREGLDRLDYIPGVLGRGDSVAVSAADSVRLRDWDRLYTGAALALGWDLYRGAGVEKRVSYDGISGLYRVRDEQWLVNGLVGVRTSGDLREWVAALLPAGKEYALMRDSLAVYRLPGPSYRAASLAVAMNAYRWVHHFGFEKLIVVNIPSAMLRYYAADTLGMVMKVVVGQPSRRTPRFAGWCDGLVLYPYWNVPRKIAVAELLPLFRMSPDMARTMQLQVVDAGGRTIDPATIRWASYNASNFPYRIRQAPGCWNALGVLKFNLSDPFDVYMHDTNLKKVFGSSYRYYSHGCIRLERPIDLGQALSDNKLDPTFLLSCFKDQQPVAMPLLKRVPVFVLYNTVGLDAAGRLAWYKDVYQLGE